MRSFDRHLVLNIGKERLKTKMTKLFSPFPARHLSNNFEPSPCYCKMGQRQRADLNGRIKWHHQVKYQRLNANTLVLYPPSCLCSNNYRASLTQHVGCDGEPLAGPRPRLTELWRDYLAPLGLQGLLNIKRSHTCTNFVSHVLFWPKRFLLQWEWF